MNIVLSRYNIIRQYVLHTYVSRWFSGLFDTFGGGLFGKFRLSNGNGVYLVAFEVCLGLAVFEDVLIAKETEARGPVLCRGLGVVLESRIRRVNLEDGNVPKFNRRHRLNKRANLQVRSAQKTEPTLRSLCKFRI